LHVFITAVFLFFRYSLTAFASRRAPTKKLLIDLNRLRQG
jgi:hypothetical protein